MALRPAERFLPRTPVWIAYNLVLWAALLTAAPVWIPWMLAAGKRRSNFMDRLGFGLSRLSPRRASPGIWIHSVSVGETLAAAPLVRALKIAMPSLDITVTTVTVTGQETARKIIGDSADNVCYFPFDLSSICGRYLDRIRPDAVVILETEIWPNFLAECASRGIPVVILNGRMSERSFCGYRRLSFLFRRILSDVDAIGAQTPADARRYSDLRGTPENVLSTGNMKYDMTVPETEPGLAGIMSRSRESGVRWIVAGSTHEGEETRVLEGFALARLAEPSIKLLLAPRHPERFDRVERLCLDAGFPVSRKTSCLIEGFKDDVPVLLLDTVGELSGAYALADVAFVGGSLVPVGGHNLLEPACFGVPIMTGPHLHNFLEMASLFRKADAVSVVESPVDFGKVLTGLLGDAENARRMGSRGRELMRANQGATARNVKLVLEAISGREGFGR